MVGGGRAKKTWVRVASCGLMGYIRKRAIQFRGNRKGVWDSFGEKYLPRPYEYVSRLGPPKQGPARSRPGDLGGGVVEKKRRLRKVKRADTRLLKAWDHRGRKVSSDVSIKKTR